jgi:hypothetical protein
VVDSGEGMRVGVLPGMIGPDRTILEEDTRFHQVNTMMRQGGMGTTVHQVCMTMHSSQTETMVHRRACMTMLQKWVYMKKLLHMDRQGFPWSAGGRTLGGYSMTVEEPSSKASPKMGQRKHVASRMMGGMNDAMRCTSGA